MLDSIFLSRRLITTTMFALVLGFAACSNDNGTAPDDDGNGGGGGGGGGNPTIEDTLRVQTVEDLASQLDQWDGMEPDSIAARAVAYLDGVPSIEAVGITPGTTTVWARFEDGVSLIIPNNRETTTAVDTLVDEAIVPPPARGASAAPRAIPDGRKMTTALSVPTSALELPAQATFRALNPIGTCHVNPLPVVRSLLRQGGYRENSGSATVNGLKGVRGDGVFYINTHGGIGLDPQQNGFFALWTATPFNLTTLGDHLTMLANNDVVIMVEKSNDPLGNCLNLSHLGITAHFVNEFMSFPKNSLVIIDACDSGSANAIDMRQAFENAGASVYVGWTQRVADQFAYKAVKYLLDRMLGVNQISPETPKQRAFNIDDVRDDMANNRNLVVDPYRNAVLTVFKMQHDFGLLSPTIQFLSIEGGEDMDKLYIAGVFGTDPGEANRSVTIGGVALSNVVWEPTLITGDLPTEVAGTAVVEVGTGSNPRRSNEVNLTEWRGQIVYERDDPGSQQAQLTMNVHFRADVHAFRDKPGEQPWKTTVLFNAMRDATMDVEASGVHVVTDQCTDTYTLDGDEHFGSPWESNPLGGYGYLGQVDTQDMRLFLGVHTFTLFNGARWVHGGPEECGSFDLELYISVKIDECLYDEAHPGFVAGFDMELEPNFSVAEGERGPCTVAPLVAPLVQLSAQASVRWGAMTATHPPDPDAAR